MWGGAASPNPARPDPVRWVDVDVFGPRFVVDLVDDAPLLAYIIHRGDTKDPGPDQFLSFDSWGYEVWQLEGEHPSDPSIPHYVLPIVGSATPVVDASLTFDHGGENAAWFQVGYSCNNASRATITESAIDGAHLEDGEVVHLVTIEPDDEDGRRWRRGKKTGKLKI